MDVVWKSIKNTVLATVGTISAIIGFIGIFLPLVPGIPFLILAGVCFSMIES